MIKSYYVCDICGARVDADTISNYNVMFKKVTLKAETIPPTLPYSKNNRRMQNLFRSTIQ